MKGTLIQKDEDPYGLTKVNSGSVLPSIYPSQVNLKMGIDGPIVGVGQRNEKMIHSYDSLNEVLEKNKEELKK